MGLCVAIHPRAMLAGALAPGRVIQAEQVEGNRPHKVWSNLVSFFLSILWFSTKLSVPYFFVLSFVLPSLTCRSALSDAGWKQKQTNRMQLFEKWILANHASVFKISNFPSMKRIQICLIYNGFLNQKCMLALYKQRFVTVCLKLFHEAIYLP